MSVDTFDSQKYGDDDPINTSAVSPNAFNLTYTVSSETIQDKVVTNINKDITKQNLQLKNDGTSQALVNDHELALEVSSSASAESVNANKTIEAEHEFSPPVPVQQTVVSQTSAKSSEIERVHQSGIITSFGSQSHSLDPLPQANVIEPNVKISRSPPVQQAAVFRASGKNPKIEKALQSGQSRTPNPVEQTVVSQASAKNSKIERIHQSGNNPLFANESRPLVPIQQTAVLQASAKKSGPSSLPATAKNSETERTSQSEKIVKTIDVTTHEFAHPSVSELIHNKPMALESNVSTHHDNMPKVDNVDMEFDDNISDIGEGSFENFEINMSFDMDNYSDSNTNAGSANIPFNSEFDGDFVVRHYEYLLLFFYAEQKN